MTMIVAAMNDMMRLAKAADMMRLAKAADMPSWVDVIGGIHRIRWIHWIPKRLLLGVRLRLIRDCWRRESTSARMHHWATLGIAVLQLAAANPGGTFTKETRLVYSAELVVLPSLQRQKATQTALCGIRNMWSPIRHSGLGFLSISIAWHFGVWPRGVWQSVHIWHFGQVVCDILFWLATQSCILCKRRCHQHQQQQDSTWRHGTRAQGCVKSGFERHKLCCKVAAESKSFQQVLLWLQAQLDFYMATTMALDALDLDLVKKLVDTSSSNQPQHPSCISEITKNYGPPISLPISRLKKSRWTVDSGGETI